MKEYLPYLTTHFYLRLVILVLLEFLKRKKKIEIYIILLYMKRLF